MNHSLKRAMMVALTAAAAAGIGYALIQLRRTNTLAKHTVDAIEAQIRALDPVTTAEVIAKLSADAVKEVKSKGLG